MSVGVIAASDVIGGGVLSYQATVLADSPQVYWRLGEGSGLSAFDTSGNGRTASWSGAPSYVSGLITGDPNGAIKPGAQFSTLADAAWMDSNVLSIEAWVQFDTLVASAGVVDRYAGGGVGQSAFLLYAPSNKWTFITRDNVNSDRTAQDSATIVAGNRYHLVGTCDGSNARLYVNGALAGGPTAVGGGGAAAGSAPIVIGRFVFSGAGTAGTIDEVAYYTSALSAARVLAHYNAGV